MKKRSVTIRELRGDLSQEEFAAKLGVNQATVSRWETNGISRYARLLIEAKLGVRLQAAAA